MIANHRPISDELFRDLVARSVALARKMLADPNLPTEMRIQLLKLEKMSSELEGGIDG